MSDKTINIENNLDNITDIDAFINDNQQVFNTKDFHSYLKSLLNDSDLKVKDIINATYIDQSYCYQIFRGLRMPKRDKIIQLAFALQANLDVTNRLLKLSGQAPLYVKDLRDAIVIFSIKNSKTLDQLEQILIDKNLCPLSEG